ncbi:threonine aldolase family protein [Luteimonas cucumeris]|uniref:threonine aldolase family protein n=1 Tax=Luteimonas cucumeris TaxID=985012 RepID=UPI001A7E4719|nr:beta-eliminating lyase-related protein [Luteimonas cucumeris]
MTTDTGSALLRGATSIDPYGDTDMSREASCNNPARRRLLAATLPASLMMFDLAQAARAAPGYGASAPRPALGERSVMLMGDAVPQPALDWSRHLQQLVERTPDARDSYLAEGAVRMLETRFAALLGKPDAAFLPTGTLANHLAMRVLCGENRHALVQHDSHLYLDESNAATTLSGLHLVPLAKGRAAPTLQEVIAAIDEAENGPYPLKVGAISLESPVRRADGAMVPYPLARSISQLARSKQIGLHLDGARLLLASGLPGFELKAYSALFDTVYVSLYKYLDAPFGAILAGDETAIAKVRDLRHVFGATIYQGWPAALPALAALDGFQDRFIAARRVSEQLFAGLEAAGGFTLRPVENGSNITFLELGADRAVGLADRLRQADIHLRKPRDGRVQIDINQTLLRRSADELIRAFVGA